MPRALSVAVADLRSSSATTSAGRLSSGASRTYLSTDSPAHRAMTMIFATSTPSAAKRCAPVTLKECPPSSLPPFSVTIVAPVAATWASSVLITTVLCTTSPPLVGKKGIAFHFATPEGFDEEVRLCHCRVVRAIVAGLAACTNATPGAGAPYRARVGL